MNNATLGGVDWNDFPLALDDIERIEVVRGPSTASHGIGAFLGTINFITKHPHCSAEPLRRSTLELTISLTAWRATRRQGWLRVPDHRGTPVG
jgi:outer membrane cobalamin receptor